MAKVSTGGVTASGKKASTAAPKMGDPNALRGLLKDEAGVSTGVTFAGNCDHLHLRAPGPVYNKKTGERVGEDAGVFIDFGGVGLSREFDPTLGPDHKFIHDMREILEQEPQHPDVRKYNIRELLPEEPAPPFARWDEFNAPSIKTWLEASLSGDHDTNVALVKECARYEAANKDRDDVLAMLSALMATEASVSDAFATEIKMA